MSHVFIDQTTVRQNSDFLSIRVFQKKKHRMYILSLSQYKFQEKSWNKLKFIKVRKDMCGNIMSSNAFNKMNSLVHIYIAGEAVFWRKLDLTRKLSSRMRTNRTVTGPSSERVAMSPIVDRKAPVRTLPYLPLAVGN